MTKPMKRPDVDDALADNNCRVLRQGKEHTIWQCACGQGHKAAVPRHRQTSAGVVRDISKKMACLPEGWLQ